MAEWPKAAVCKTVKSQVQILPDAPNFMNIEQLFPYALGISNIGRPFTDAEKAAVDKLVLDVRANSGNFSTNITNVLELDDFANLRSIIQSKLDEYFQEVYDPKDDVKPVISLSWLNYTRQDGYHHKHRHPNSFLSGVLYINVHPKFDYINFYDPRYNPIEIVTNNTNRYNSQFCTIPVNAGDLILFPSHIEHGVERVKHNYLRISLAFNVWLKGTIGTHERLTSLYL